MKINLKPIINVIGQFDQSGFNNENWPNKLQFKDKRKGQDMAWARPNRWATKLGD